MKSIKHWLETLPEPYRTEAFEEYARQPLSHSYQESLYDALWFGFVWSSSKQGHDYWQDIANRADQGEFDQPSELEALRKEVAELKARLAETKPLKAGDRVRVDVPLEGVVVGTDYSDGTVKVRLDGTELDEWAFFLESRLTRIG